MNKKTINGLLTGAAWAAALCGSGAVSASTLAVTNLATVSNGISIVGASADATVDNATINARISRSRQSRVLVSQRLRFTVIGADGNVRATADRFVGPAQLPRGNSRDGHLAVTLAAAPQATDRIVVEWASAGAGP